MTDHITNPEAINDHLCHGIDHCEVCGAEAPPPWPRMSWVCDGCMARVTRSEIADMADGEHVLCKACAQ